jgi:hypothetical protein
VVALSSKRKKREKKMIEELLSCRELRWKEKGRDKELKRKDVRSMLMPRLKKGRCKKREGKEKDLKNFINRSRKEEKGSFLSREGLRTFKGSKKNFVLKNKGWNRWLRWKGRRELMKNV